jgi:hypothetical protein
MKQIARNVTMEGWVRCGDCRYLLHDRDTKFTRSFRAIIASGRVEPLALPARSPNLNAYSELWVRSVKEECLCKLLLIGERSLLQCRERLGGCCIIIIKRPRNLAEKSRMILWLEANCICAKITVLLANAQVSPNIACAVDRKSHERLGNNQRASIP